MQENTTRGDYMTRGYYLVKDVLMSASGAHLSADEIYASLLSRGERLGRSTIYRQLERLVKEGVARRISGDRSESCCYSYASEGCEEHYHAVCTVCGRLTHLSCDHIEALLGHVKAEHGFLIDPTRTTLYGRCAACTRAEKKGEHHA